MNRRFYELHCPQKYVLYVDYKSWYKNSLVQPSNWFDACTRSLK